MSQCLFITVTRSLPPSIHLMSGTQDLHPYTQGVLTFVDTDGDYGADTQGVDYGYQFTPLSQSQTQTQVSQLTQNDSATSKGEQLLI